MATELTKKEKGFADDYLDTGNGTLAAKQNYDVANDNTAASIASQNLRKLKIQEYLEEHAEQAASMVYQLSQTAEAEPVRLNASKDILDRAGFKPVEKSQSIVIKGNAKDITAFNDLKDEYERKLRERIINQ